MKFEYDLFDAKHALKTVQNHEANRISYKGKLNSRLHSLSKVKERYLRIFDTETSRFFALPFTLRTINSAYEYFGE